MSEEGEEPVEAPAGEPVALQGWAVVEVMGHRRMAGRIEEVVIAGAGFLRVTIPTGRHGFTSPASASEVEVVQLYRPSAIFSITPCDEETARRFGRQWGAPRLGGYLEGPAEACGEERPFRGGYG